jgi:Flp pilus assembly protein TadG
MTNSTGSRKRRQGQSTLEFALALLVLIPLLLGAFDLGRAVYINSVVAAAAQEGARYGIVHRGDASGIQGAARSQVAGLDGSMVNVAITYPTATSVEVTVSYLFSAVTPLIGNIIGNGGQITLSNTARMSL